jgi:hypothetical protein
MENVSYFTPWTIKTLQNTIKRPNQYAVHSFYSSQGRLLKNILVFYRISSSQITHFTTRIKTSAPYLADDSLTNSMLIGKKHLSPPCRRESKGWRGVRVGWVGWVGWLAGLAGLAGLDI